jgi:hypothetical protein
MANFKRRTCTSYWVRLNAEHSRRTFTHDPAGNDPELDPNRPADPPTRAIEKPVMRHGKREGSDLPKPIPERQSHQNRAKQTDNANENGTSGMPGVVDTLGLHWIVI